jgi:hypothetical protein
MRTSIAIERVRWTVRVAAFAFAVGVAVLSTPALRAQAGAQGQWSTLLYPMPINPVHMALMHTGKVLIVTGSGNVAAETNFRSAVWDLQAETIAVTSSLPWDMFCNAMVTLPDGRVFINGGNLQYDPFHGQPKNAAFDPASGLFTDLQPMLHGRWYPTATVLGDGRVMTFSGLSETGATNTAVEIYTPGTGWSQQYSAGWTPPLYPRMHLLPNGNVIYTGSGTGTRIFNTAAKTWSLVATTNYAGTRTYGTSVLLPLTPADGYKPRVMIFGGGNPATATTEILDASAATLAWQPGPSMSQPRIEMNATILPNGKVLAVGGSKNDEDAATASLNADLYDPLTNTFASAGANRYPRLYHSNSLLLPDATVLLAGGNPTRGAYETHLEIYSPAYLFNADGTPALRPTITGVGAGALPYGGTLEVETPDAAGIASVVLVRPGAPTHAFDMDQRLVGLTYSAGAGVLTVSAPPNGNIAPPGYYMLFILNSAGVPSIASFVQVLAAAPNQPPVAAIQTPASDVTVNPGQAVAFAGAGSDADGVISAYGWTFSGGSPSASAQAVPGGVTYSTPGTYLASFTVTDDDGVVSAPATRTVTVSNFSISATPAVQSVPPTASTTFTVSLLPGPQFTGTVDFSVTGLPANTTWAFSPPSIAASGATTLTVTTSSTTPAGSYPLTIRGTSGSVVRTATVTLTVSVTVTGDFSLSGTPASQTVNSGAAGTYTMSVGALLGFSGTVNLSVGALPKFVTAAFSRASITQSGTSGLTLSTKKQTKPGTYSVTVTGTSGGTLVPSTTVVLVVR